MSNVFFTFWFLIFVASLLSPAMVFVLYPLSLWIVSVFKSAEVVPSRDEDQWPFVSVVIVARNAENIIASKLRNGCELDYPPDRYEIIVFSDGSEDATEEIVQEFDDRRVTLYSSSQHRGKANGLNEAVQKCQGEIIVFSDADALLDEDAIQQLVGHYSDPLVGGVCGQRILEGPEAPTGRAQAFYVGFDSRIKQMESVIGSMTSNDGKLYSVRRRLFRPINPGTADDLDCCLNVVAQKKRFVFEPRARAVAPVPSRNMEAEINRRRRIVCGSMKSIFSHAELFNPVGYGMYGVRLGINKVLRRLLPVNLIILFMASFALWGVHPAFRFFAFLQGVFYLIAGLYTAMPRRLKTAGGVFWMFETAFYFCAGNVGMLLGLWDYLRGREYVTWEPTSSKGRME